MRPGRGGPTAPVAFRRRCPGQRRLRPTVPAHAAPVGLALLAGLTMFAVGGGCRPSIPHRAGECRRDRGGKAAPDVARASARVRLTQHHPHAWYSTRDASVRSLRLGSTSSLERSHRVPQWVMIAAVAGHGAQPVPVARCAGATRNLSRCSTFQPQSRASPARTVVVLAQASMTQRRVSSLRR